MTEKEKGYKGHGHVRAIIRTKDKKYKSASIFRTVNMYENAPDEIIGIKEKIDFTIQMKRLIEYVDMKVEEGAFKYEDVIGVDL